MLVTVCFYFLSKREREKLEFLKEFLRRRVSLVQFVLVYACERRVDCELCVEFLSDDGASLDWAKQTLHTGFVFVLFR